MKTTRTRRGAKVTLRDVAEAAGVSLASTSRAISKPETASPRVRARVIEACQALNYIPNHVARSLTTRRSNAVGVIIPTIENPVFMPMLQSMIEVLNGRGYALQINVCDRDPDREYEQTLGLVRRGVDAVLLGNPTHNPEVFKLLEDRGTPYVCVAGSAADRQKRIVTFDGRRASFIGVDHLVAAGHRRIGVFSGPADTTPVIRDRLEGAIEALAKHGFRPEKNWIVEAAFSAAEVRLGARKILAASSRPTAIVCTGDSHAMALMSECRESGLVVPDDMSIVGCNDLFYIRLASPVLTTVKTPYSEIGYRSANMALDMLSGAPVKSKIIIEATLLEGQTVTKPRNPRR